MKKFIIGTGLFLGGAATGVVLLEKAVKLMIHDTEYMEKNVYPRFRKILVNKFGEEKVNRIIETLGED